MNNNFCPKCGNKLYKESNFCNNCGFKLNQIIETNKNQKSESYDEKGYLILIGFFSLLLPFVGIILYYSYKGKDEKAADVASTWLWIGITLYLVLFIGKKVAIRMEEMNKFIHKYQ